jgi:hypothetical protein
MANNQKLIRGALGMVMPASEPEPETKPLGKLGKLPSLVGKEESKEPITSDPEAMEAISNIKQKGYGPEEVEEAFKADDTEDSQDVGMKAGLSDSLHKVMQSR